RCARPVVRHQGQAASRSPIMSGRKALVLRRAVMRVGEHESVSRESWLELRRVQLIDWEEYAMVRKALRTTPLLLLLAVSVPAFAQYVATPQPGQTTAAPSATAENLTITAKNGQTQEQQWSDRYECHRWARNQSGFDPTQPPSGLTP